MVICSVVLLLAWIGCWTWILDPSRVVHSKYPASSFADHVLYTMMGFALAPYIPLTLLSLGFPIAAWVVPPRLTRDDTFGRAGLIIGLGFALGIALIASAVALVAPFVRPACL